MSTCLNRNFLLRIICAGLICIRVSAQSNEPSKLFPAAYNNLTTDTARMRYLVKEISDSLNDGRLHFVYDLARAGLVLATKNNIDTMKGNLLF